MKFSKFYLGKMIEEKQRNEGLLGTICILMGYLRWGRGDNATGIQPIDFGKVRSLDFRGQVLRFFRYDRAGGPLRRYKGPGSPFCFEAKLQLLLLLLHY